MKTVQRLFLVLALCMYAGCASQSYFETRPPEEWRGISRGMTKEEVYAHLGSPLFVTDNQDVWKADGWELQVAYDEEGKVTEAVNLHKMRRLN